MVGMLMESLADLLADSSSSSSVKLFKLCYNDIYSEVTCSHSPSKNVTVYSVPR